MKEYQENYKKVWEKIKTCIEEMPQENLPEDILKVKIKVIKNIFGLEHNDIVNDNLSNKEKPTTQKNELSKCDHNNKCIEKKLPNKKYELVGSDKPGLYRIRALIDFWNVKAGDIGGYVSGEHNLSQENNCWIYNNAIVKDNATVTDYATVMDNAVVMDNSVIKDMASVRDNALIMDNTIIMDQAIVLGSNVFKKDGVINKECVWF